MLIALQTLPEEAVTADLATQLHWRQEIALEGPVKWGNSGNYSC